VTDPTNCPRLNTAPDVDATRWGWYSKTGATCFDMYAGAGLNNMGNGCYVGTVTLGSHCSAEGDGQSLTYQGYKLCFKSPGDLFNATEYHVHIGTGLPKKRDGTITVAPGSYEVAPGGIGDYRIVHLVVEAGTGAFDNCDGECIRQGSECLALAPGRRQFLGLSI
jgi:hypothetical protein